ncbi:MAG TPA: glucan biosynthesis protein, partial [Steroidobacteraceae bacterium]|nr:glucan biosynthesis protein [Steroidobacteraceae bacterium]
MIAVLLLASAMLSLNEADQGTPPAGAAPSEHRIVTPPPTPQTAPPAEPGPFTFAKVQELARQRAAREFRPPPTNLPAALANLTYDQYRDIRFRPTSALWRDKSLFEVQFFHRGYRVRQRV